MFYLKKNFLVDFIGQSGSGKSTIIELVADSINKSIALSGSRCYVARNVDFFSYFMIFNFLLHHPRILKYYKLICKNSKLSIPIYSRWILLLARHSWYKNSFSFYKENTIYLFDEGLVHHLPKWSDNVSDDFLLSCSLPNIVVQLNTNPIQAIYRKLNRSKPLGQHKIKKGKRKFEKALQLTKILLKEQKDDDVRIFLRDWSMKNCYTSFTDFEINSILYRAKDNSFKEKKMIFRKSSTDSLRVSLEKNGISFLKFDTSDNFLMDSVVHSISCKIVEHIKNYTNV
ncbi:hypothetical protein [Desulfonatronum thiodismutans]|uniref:hypothetical protein n=1 Tax=Desulfonatronum thiodismutans TaxID=159290 RepID=UPI0012688434|nr:hypothetical protein [Desulfonatronum thiodismutans]